MVLNRHDKRKRKEGDLVDLMDPLSASPKRTKVHAQRKFAQGAATVFNSPTLPMRDKEKVKPAVFTELITHKRPNTEDFLTFLCFRGTSILPPNLNFFNVGPKKDKLQSKSVQLPQENTPSTSAKIEETLKVEIASKAVTKVKSLGADKKKASNLHKPLTKFKSTSSTIQALKKKYQEQRLAKQRIKDKIKTSCVMQTRSCTERTILKPTNKVTPRKFLPKFETRRRSLRSNVIIEKTKKLVNPKSKLYSVKPKRKIITKQKEPDTSSSDSSSEAEEAFSEKSETQNKRTTKNSVSKKICTRSKSEARRVTRSHSETVSPQNVSKRPSRKTKEAATVYMDLFRNNFEAEAIESLFDNVSEKRKLKVKSKSSTKSEDEEKKSGNTSKATGVEKRSDKAKTSKNIPKSKRTSQVQRYCESDSEENSVSSADVASNTRPTTRRSLNDSNKSMSRSLRSSSRNTSTDTQPNPKLRSQGTNFRANKEKIIFKRKRNPAKNQSEKSVAKKECRVNSKETAESEEETLGMLLCKIKKKKSDDEKEEAVKKENDETNAVKIIKLETSKVSDDEGSFRGFTKKAISKVLSSCQTHVNTNFSTLEETSPNSEPMQIHESNLIAKPEESFANKIATPLMDLKSSQQPSIEPKISDFHVSAPAKSEKRCSHEAVILPAEIVDPTISALSRKEHTGRKERVNMSTEQIEKWLNESSLAKEESKLEMESVSNFRYETKTSEISVKTDVPHLSIPTKIQHLVRPVNVALSKLTEKATLKERPISLSNKSGIILTTVVQQTDSKSIYLQMNRKNVSEVDDSKTLKPKNEGIDTTPKSDDTVADESDKKSTPDKKSLRKPFLPKVKERKSSVPNINAFSPENESSVYAFESDTEVPVSTPFRSKARDAKFDTVDNERTKTGNKDGVSDYESKKSEEKTIGEEQDDALRNQADALQDQQTNKFELPKNFANLANMQVLSLDKLTTNWSSINCSASIAVQVNLDGQIDGQERMEIDDVSQQRSTEISTQTDINNDNEDDNDDQLYYIPLQAISRSGSNLVQGQQLIQGVAVKLGTEGPNQRVLLRAKLVTKPPVTVARCPPIGTVQPTTRTPSTITTTSSEHLLPSTSTSVAIAEFHPPLPARVDSNVHVVDRRPSSSSSSTIEKTAKSPKTSRERKTSMDSTKSGKSGKRSQAKKQKNSESPMPNSSSSFPGLNNENDEARLVEAPTFHPTEKDFQDPLEYIDKIRPIAEKFGICKVVPPQNFKPECKVSDDMRFTAYNQYVHRMLHRWGPNVKEMMAIKKYLATQSITLNHPPWIGGMEVDLPHLYQTVQSLGGLKEVIEKKKWQKVADGMKIPKSAQDRVTKLDDIYCKYLLPYDTLSPEERNKLFDEVEEDWIRRESKALQRQNTSITDNEDDEEDDSSDEIEECIVKGRNMPLNAFYRIARNTQRMWFGENSKSGNETEGASADEVESAFWKHVAERKRHVCVHAASIDSSGRGFGFSVAKNSPFARHPWNLKVLTNNAGSVLRALGPIMGVTVPTLHVGMLFSACCWYRDPHGLPWIEYLHTGAKKIWYGIPDEHNNNFQNALSKMVPRYCKNKTIWLPSDTAMVPPELLVKNGVPLCHIVQEPGQFIIVFPKAFTSSICTGYVVSESVYFAQPSWLETAEQVFKDIQDSCEPSIFSFERLLFNIINDSRSHIDVLRQVLPIVLKIREREIEHRKRLDCLGLKNTQRLPLPDSGKRKKGKQVKEDDSDYECETCRANLFVSLMSNSQDDSVYCLTHAVQFLIRKKNVMKHCTLMYTYSKDELDELIRKLEDKIEAKSKKTNQIKQSK